MAYKVFTNGSVLNASEVNDNLMNQAVITFTNSTARASAITSPVEGMITYLGDTQTYESWDGTAWVAFGGGGSAGTQNAIINGAFDIWQRGTTFTNQATQAYSADRWKVSTSNTTIDVSRSTFTLGAAPLSGLDGKFFATVSADSTDSDPRFIQAIEKVQSFAGQTVTVSFYAKSTVATDALRWIRLQQVFGTGGSPSSTVDTDSSSVTLTNSWTRYTRTISVPSISGKTLGTDGNDRLELQFGLKTSTAQTLDIWGVQVEPGTTATNFRRNCSNIGEELASCQRYYWRVTSADGTFMGVANGPGTGGTSPAIRRTSAIPYPVQMRTKPSVSISGTHALQDGTLTSIGFASLSGNRGTPNWLSAEINSTSNSTAHRPYMWIIDTNSASDYLEASAEL